jgi:hypothetical protein
VPDYVYDATEALAAAEQLSALPFQTPQQASAMSITVAYLTAKAITDATLAQVEATNALVAEQRLATRLARVQLSLNRGVSATKALDQIDREL